MSALRRRVQMVDAALEYAELGWPVFPCYPGEKNPRIKGWQDKATTDEATIRSWWREWPDANIGMVTGARSGIVVVDTDGPEGEQTLDALGLDLPETWMQSTPHGGFHRFFRYAGTDIRNSARKLGPKIDVRGGGGLVILSPSSLHDGSYKWDEIDCDIAAAPSELVALLAVDATARRNGHSEAAGDPIPEGGRNATLTSLAGTMRRPGMTADEILAALLIANTNRCVPPLLNSEVEEIAASVSRYDPEQVAHNGNGNGRLRSALVFRPADATQAAPTVWAWEQRVPIGYLSLLLGNEGIGKGTLISWVIARLTRGELPGDLHGEPSRVAIIGDEDSFNHVWTPRLSVAGADLERVGVIERPDYGYVDLTEDRDRIASIVSEHEIRLLYLDQLLDNLGAKVDDWRTKQVRTALQPVRALAADLDVAVHAAMHPNKRGETFRELVSGAVAFNAVSRSSLLLDQHPEDPERRVLVRGKGNLSEEPGSFEFDVLSAEFSNENGESSMPLASPITANGDLSVHDLVGETESYSKAREARDFLAEHLPNDGEWHVARPLLQAAKARGLDERTIQRAKKSLGISHRREDKFKAASEWKWQLHVGPRSKAVDNDA